MLNIMPCQTCIHLSKGVGDRFHRNVKQNGLAMNNSSATRQRGTILVSVLWILIFLGFLAVTLRVQMSGVVASVHVTEDKATARTLAQAGLAQAAAEIRAGPPDDAIKPTDRISSTITLPTGTVTISANNEALRIDLNTAERPLIVGALRAAGATPGTADDLAKKIMSRRTRPDAPNKHPSGFTPQQDERSPGLFQTVSELAALPGITSEIAIAMDPYVTVSSGLAGVRIEALDDKLLASIPGLPSTAQNAIRNFRAGRLSHEQLDQSLTGITFNTPVQASTWRVQLRMTLQSGYSESFEALVLISNADEEPYRVLGWRRVTTEWK